MNEEEFIKILNESWEIDNGFFYELRNLKFNYNKGQQLYSSIVDFKLGDELLISRDLVRLIWYIPIYMEYQKETLKTRLKDVQYNKFVILSNKIQKEVERLLGYP